MTGNEARKIFLDYFKKHQHQIVRSASLIPHDDPTLLFVNAGMVQFKRTFIGEEKRDYTTAATAQKCVRAGGKHNDLDNVGFTARHHTFFEMLGNFSFGDYFKERAVAFAWDLLLNGYGLPKEKLWVSVYMDDDEAYDIWQKQMGVPTDRIVRLGEKDNFWAMGDTGPCGPCSEVHIDRGAAFGCGKPDCGVGCDCDRFLEIWNLVFMQFNRDAGGNMQPLPKPSIDTGMGLERIVSVVQDVPTNYDTDLFLPIIHKVEALSGKKLGKSPDDDVAMKVIADHSRAAAFLIGDGIMPSNEGRGYVLRRIMRRAIRFGRKIELNKPFLHTTAAAVIANMASAYPELSEAEAFITNVIQNEETQFSKTLDNGLKLLNDCLEGLHEKGQTEVPGDVIFKLYDTYGFPVDIIEDVIRDDQLTLDMAGYNHAMDEQRRKSQTTLTFQELGDAYKSLAGAGTKCVFTGYDSLSGESVVLLIAENGQEVPEAAAGAAVEIVTQATPFYAESGGQMGDIGHMFNTHVNVAVSDTKKDPTGLIIHYGTIVSGVLKKGAPVSLNVDADHRRNTALNHTATHILHTTLRRVLGDHVKQAGSLVTAQRLRFDFSHFSAVDRKTLDQIEAIVNENIRANIAVGWQEMDMEQALKTGAIALFDEKYGDSVRVVSIENFSKEFCGGTHTRQTGDIGLFKIIGESSIASGVRRIEALTGDAALAYIQAQSNTLAETAAMLREKPDMLHARVEKLLADQRNLEKEVERLKAKLAAKSTDDVEKEYNVVNGIKILSKRVPIDNPSALRELADKFRDKISSGIVVLGAVTGPKALLIVLVTKDLTKQYHAGKLIKQIAAEVGGGGGGRPDMAQAGGPRSENLDKALAKIFEIV